jgi:chaperonin GroEL (HSP60 family)
MNMEYEEMENHIAFNVVTNKSGNFLEVGVVDPVEVLIAGCESAVSIAGILLTSSGMIIESEKLTNNNQ